MLETVIYIAVFVLVFAIYLAMRARSHRRGQATLQASVASGLMEPASLHPVFDEALCIGCGACVSACPEGNVIGLIGGKAKLTNPSHCIGHGACKVACPFDAITLVFGTEKRVIDIPNVSPTFETNVPGVFIAGELGGMGLIANAIEQGRQAMDSVAKHPRLKGKGDIDVLIVGAGPSGISATLAAKEKGLSYKTIEQDSFGGTVAHFPRGKIVMTRPADIPIIGKVKLRETTKEALLELWQDIRDKTGIEISYGERLESVQDGGQTFQIVTNRGTYAAKTVLLAIGRRGTPRKLGVPGENLNKVVYRLIDPAQYQGQHVLVVGGGDSALEAATSIAEEPGTDVTLSYRSGGFNRAKEKNRNKVDALKEAGRLRVLLQSNVIEVTEEKVLIRDETQDYELPNDAIIVCAGGILPTPMLKEMGIEVETKYGTA